MTIQDQSDGPDSSFLLPRGNGVLLDSGGETPTGEGLVPKVRKPYTITKQRERWTEEEHKKFLEALKLHGRAWRKIEDHVGTKTAVQIRSHAQKFFSKVVRESNTAAKPIEIPPPRPKRKPMHPYPRKLVIPAKSDMPPQDQSERSASPNSLADQEDRSPTSVLSGAASDATDSSTRDHCLSPMSSNDNGSRNLSQSDEPLSLKLELFPNVGSFTNEGSPEVTSSKFLKLFGKTVLLENAENPSSPSINEPQPTEVGPSAPVPLRVFCGGVSFPSLTFDNVNSMKEELKEGSGSGLSAGSVNAPGNYLETETHSHQYSTESPTSRLSLSPVAQPMLRANLKRANSENYTRAFVPYKRSLSERGTRSSTITAEEKKAQETRLCL